MRGRPAITADDGMHPHRLLIHSAHSFNTHRILVSSACLLTPHSKSKCDGQQPVCGPCRDSGRADEVQLPSRHISLSLILYLTLCFISFFLSFFGPCSVLGAERQRRKLGHNSTLNLSSIISRASNTGSKSSNQSSLNLAPRENFSETPQAQESPHQLVWPGQKAKRKRRKRSGNYT